MSNEGVKHDDRQDREGTVYSRCTTMADLDDERANHSSLIPVHKLSTPDPLYDLQLLRDLTIINERIVRELGALPAGGLPALPKRKPRAWAENVVAPTQEEANEEMKLRRIALAATLGATTIGMCAGPAPAQIAQQIEGTQLSETASGIKNAIKKKEPAYRKTFSECMNAASGVTVDTMNCIDEEFAYQDKRLNSVYRALHEVLTPAKWDVLRDEQRKWLAGRDICEMDDDIVGGTAEMLIRADCALRKTAFRADELQTLLKQQGHR